MIPGDPGHSSPPEAAIPVPRRSSIIAVIGATGQSGIPLLNALQSTPARVRAVVHSRLGAERAAKAGADETVQAELADPASITAALEGVEHVYMIPPPFDPDEQSFAITALRAAESRGAARFVYVSVLHPHTPALRHHIRKAGAEAAIRESSLAWTILQPSMYAQQAWALMGNAPPGAVTAPFDTARSFSVIDLIDLSAVAVRVLTEDGHACATYELCGPQHTMDELVGIASRVRGVPLEPRRVAPSDAPIPPRFARSVSAAADVRAMWAEYDHHGFRGNSNVLQMLLARPPTSFED